MPPETIAESDRPPQPPVDTQWPKLARMLVDPRILLRLNILLRKCGYLTRAEAVRAAIKAGLDALGV